MLFALHYDRVVQFRIRIHFWRVKFTKSEKWNVLICDKPLNLSVVAQFEIKIDWISFFYETKLHIII